DTPLDDGLSAELAPETFTKRLGLTSTVAAQIDRYREMAERGTHVGDDEAVQVFRLAGRRADATLVYSDAGRRAARYAARTRGGKPSMFWRVFPRSFRRRAGERAAQRTLARVFGLPLLREGGGIQLRLTESLATRAGFEGTGCYFYSALVAELLRVTSGFEGSMVHDRCRSRGDDTCQWKAAEADQRW
ncbi:MAG: hypothetical protein IT352_18620, partial [Gemmatimonadales bacterium]|nr:hypothetical protein [Gemmatimonadales bacterium]